MSVSSTTLSTPEIRPNQRSIGLTVWDYLTKPSDLIHEPDRRQQARFVSAVLVFLLVGSFVLIGRALTTSANTPTGTNIIYFGLLALVVVVYGLSRTTHIDLTVNIYLAMSLTSLILIHLSNMSSATTLYWLILPILFGGMVLSLKNTTVFVAILVAVLFLLPKVVAGEGDISGPANFVILNAGVILVFVRFRNVLESTRKAQITESLQKVETLNQTLSQTNQELMKANALARESVRLKSEFMSTMSHELRTPLNAMLGFSGILLEGMGGEMDEEARHMVERIELNSKRLLTLINDVLDIAKIEAGRLEIVFAPMSPRTLANSWRSQISILAERKNLEFKLEFDPALPDQLYGDAERISQVAINLLSNAVKFTDSGSVKLSLKSLGDFWQIEVADTGIGIPPHAINYIFDEFRQLDGTSTRAYGGSGLGLAIVRNLCRMMDGNVQVTSKMGEGSTFTVKLPLKPVPTTESAAA